MVGHSCADASTNYSWLCNIISGRSSDSAINTFFRLLGLTPMANGKSSCFTATSSCGIFTRFPFHRIIFQQKYTTPVMFC